MDTPPSESPRWSPSFAIALAHLGADADREVTNWRRANAPESGSAAVWLCIARRALHRAGLQMTPRVQVAFDCRRYLRSGQTVNGNFVTGLEIPVAVDETPAALGVRLRALTTSGLPLAVTGALSALSHAGFVPNRIDRPPPAQPGGPVQMTYSDMGRAVPLDDSPWRPGDARVLSALLDPSGPNSVSVFVNTVGGERTVAMSFHDNVFDRRAIAKAARDIEEDPMGLLERS
jgi:hypothetical protein